MTQLLFPNVSVLNYSFYITLWKVRWGKALRFTLRLTLIAQVIFERLGAKPNHITACEVATWLSLIVGTLVLTSMRYGSTYLSSSTESFCTIHLELYLHTLSGYGKLCFEFVYVIVSGNLQQGYECILFYTFHKFV